MTISIAKRIAGAGILFVTMMAPALSETVVYGGVIHFRGAVVENPCELNSREQRLSFTCPQDGKMKTTRISYQQALRGEGDIPDSVKVSMKYLNPEKSLAIVQVDYR